VILPEGTLRELWLPNLTVALLGDFTSDRLPMLVPFYQLAWVTLLLKFLVLMSQRQVRNFAREMLRNGFLSL
jgi:hypothetical protein